MEYSYLDSAGRELGRNGVSIIRRAHTVHNHAYLDAAFSRLAKRINKLLAKFVLVKNVEIKVDAMNRR